MCVFMLKNQNLYKLKIHNRFNIAFFTGNLVLFGKIFISHINKGQLYVLLSFLLYYFLMLQDAIHQDLLYRFMLKKDSNAEELFIHA